MKDKNSLYFVPTGTPVTVKSINAGKTKLALAGKAVGEIICNEILP